MRNEYLKEELTEDMLAEVAGGAGGMMDPNGSTTDSDARGGIDPWG